MSENNAVVKSGKEFFARKEVRSSFWRSCWLQGCNTYARQQGLGFGVAMSPFLKKLYADDKDALADSLQRHTELFNITPQCVNFVMGIVMAMEEEAKINPNFDKSSINAIKVALMGPLSGIGDAIFWGSWRAIAIGIAISFSQTGSVLGPILFFVIFNSLGWAIRYFGMKIGYTKGYEFLENATSGGLFENFTMAAKILGATVVGYMIATGVGLTTTITFNINGITSSLQTDIFDTIMPNLLPLLLCFGTYFYVKKGASSTKVLLWLAIIAVVLALIEYLPFFQPVAA